MKRALPIICFVATLGLGWFLTPVPKGQPSREQRLSSRVVQNRIQVTSSQSRKRVEGIAKLATHDERVRQVIALASSVPIDEIAMWHRSNLIDALDDDLETLFFRITSERWLAANPEEFMEWAVRMDYRQADLHFAQWALKDPKSALAHLRMIPQGVRGYKLSQVISKMAAMNLDLALSFLDENLSELVSTDSGGYHLKRSLRHLADQDLDAVLAASAGWPKKARDQALPAIAGAMMKRDFSEGLALLENENLGWEGLVDSLDQKLAASLIENRNQLPEGWFSRLLARSPHYFVSTKNGLKLLEAGPEALGLDFSEMSYFSNQAGTIPMTGNNPERLMEVLNGDSFPLENRQQILRSKIQRWDRNDTAGLRKWLSTLNDSELSGVADEEVSKLENRRTAKPTVEENIAKVVGGQNLDYKLIKSLNKWTPEETGQAVEAFRALSVEEQQLSFVSIQKAVNNAPKNFEFLKEVFAEAVNLPIAEDQNILDRTNQSYRYFSETFAFQEPGRAAKWAAELPAGRRRQEAINGVITSWEKYSPSEVKVWIATLPAADQEAVKAR